MQTKRTVAHAPQTRLLAADLASLQGPCIGCKGCEGLCQALIDAMLVPDMILNGRTP
ncbi:hypothetical protein [Pseudosulfitobacter koreensis]|uniref:4Fe-4S ferredoxin-type domain-containing protein n=1 Tax=Pseudosulfitobacter koreensis TaxID=2968472 RepID=A0ABT1YVV2_9RHOB|nr:hypothetical protein [Pseudosulfitobacter koreense]MCR8825015.1 hypothetical protein [Pseudosulfitobacter koreense]